MATNWSLSAISMTSKACWFIHNPRVKGTRRRFKIYKLLAWKNKNCIVLSFKALLQNCGKRILASPCLSVYLSVCTFAEKDSAPSGRIFIKFYILGFFETLSRKFKFQYNLTRIMGTSHGDRKHLGQCTALFHRTECERYWAARTQIMENWLCYFSITILCVYSLSLGRLYLLWMSF